MKRPDLRAIVIPYIQDYPGAPELDPVSRVNAPGYTQQETVILILL